MGIYLPNMEMPKNCGECFACKAELSQEKKVIYVCCFTREEYVSDENRVETDCPLVPIPPHGRLIDADAFLALINDSTILSDFLKCIINPLIRGEPTVIEAEEG